MRWHRSKTVWFILTVTGIVIGVASLARRVHLSELANEEGERLMRDTKQFGIELGSLFIRAASDYPTLPSRQDWNALDPDQKYETISQVYALTAAANVQLDKDMQQIIANRSNGSGSAEDLVANLRMKANRYVFGAIIGAAIFLVSFVMALRTSRRLSQERSAASLDP